MMDNKFLVTQLDTAQSLPVVGEDMQRVANDILNFMTVSSMPIDLVGPPGSGKSHIGMHLAIEWARLHGVNAYSAVHDSDTTKSSAIAGFRMVGGDSIIVPGTVASALLNNSSCFIDEFTHGREGIQGGYNTISDRNHRTSAGNLTFEGGSNFRLIIAHNTVQYSGNIPLMPSFASRLAVWNFDYPSVVTEAKIASDIVKSELLKHRPENPKSKVPNSVICYLTSLMRNYREKSPTLGLSARNVATAVLLLEISAQTPNITNDTLDRHFHSDAVRRKISEYVLFKDPNNIVTADLRSDPVLFAMRFITSVGVETFRDRVMQAYMYHLDVKGGTVRSDKAMRESFHKEAI